MKTTCLSIAIFTMICALSHPSYAAEEWMTNYDKALALSKKSGKPVLANFTGSDWCHYCVKLHDEVFKTKEFSAWAKDNVILLEVDYPRSKPMDAKVKKQNESLKSKFEISGYPTVLFLDPKGNRIGNRSGYYAGGPDNWTTIASQNISAYLDSPSDIREAAAKAGEIKNFRTWTSADGREIVAKMISKTDKIVTIQMKNGRVFRLPLEKLSEEDQALLKTL